MAIFLLSPAPYKVYWLMAAMFFNWYCSFIIQMCISVLWCSIVILVLINFYKSYYITVFQKILHCSVTIWLIVVIFLAKHMHGFSYWTSFIFVARSSSWQFEPLWLNNNNRSNNNKHRHTCVNQLPMWGVCVWWGVCKCMRACSE